MSEKLIDLSDENGDGERSPSSRQKREKFVQLAERRTKTALKAIRTIAKLGNRNAYEYSEQDVKRVANALLKEIELMKGRMLSTKTKDLVDFRL